MKRVINLSMLIMTVCCCLLVSNTVTAASENIEKKSVSMYINTEKQLKVSDASENVVWKSSNNKIVSVIGTKGKNNNRAIILSKNKKGSCTIKATVGSKIYAWKVLVRQDKKISRLKLMSINITDKKIKTKLQYNNKSDKYKEYGRDYSIQRIQNGKWITIVEGNKEPTDAIQLEIEPKGKVTLSCTIAKGQEVEKFTKGVYRIKGDSTFRNDKYNYVYFHIK